MKMAWRYPERCALGCLMASSTGTQPFPYSLLFPVVVSVSPRIRHRSRLPRVGGKEGEARLCHRESEVTSLWHPRGCTHSPASLFLAEKPLTSQTPFLYRAMEETSLASHRPWCKWEERVEGTPRVCCLCHSVILLPGTQDTPPVSL